jgi:hypothetical protein
MKDSHEKQFELLHQEILGKMTPTQKWAQANTLYKLAWELKASGIRAMNPSWSEKSVQDAVRRTFLHGHT